MNGNTYFNLRFYNPLRVLVAADNKEAQSRRESLGVRAAYTGELGYDGLNGTRKIGPSYAKSVVYI